MPLVTGSRYPSRLWLTPYRQQQVSRPRPSPNTSSRNELTPLPSPPRPGDSWSRLVKPAPANNVASNQHVGARTPHLSPAFGKFSRPSSEDPPKSEARPLHVPLGLASRRPELRSSRR